MSLRHLAKRGAELAFVGSGVARLIRAIRPRVAILAYHNVVPDGDPPVGDVSLHLPLSSFRRQLDLLGEISTVVTLRDLLAGDALPDGPLSVVTFDDAYRGCLDLALPELRARGVPSTVFTAPGLLGTEGFWWDLLADPAGDGLDPRVRGTALHEHAGAQERVLAWAAEEGLRRGSLPEAYRPGTVEEVQEAAGQPGVELASHTWAHGNLVRAARGTLEEELARSLAWLEENLSTFLPVLSYPYGLATSAVEERVRAGGYQAALLVSGGAGTRRELAARRFAIPRINVPRGVSAEGFIARCTGAWGGM